MCKTKKLEIWYQKKYIIYVFLGRILEKTINIIEISNLDFVKVKEKLRKNKKSLGLRPKYLLFAYI